MINLDELFLNKEKLLKYNENIFFEFHNSTIRTGLSRPVLFIANKKVLEEADHFNMTPIEDIDYDIYVVSYEKMVVFYVIDIKASGKVTKLVPNGIILIRRKPQPVDKEGVAVRYNPEHFVVLSNKLNTISMFSRNVTADPST